MPIRPLFRRLPLLPMLLIGVAGLCVAALLLLLVIRGFRGDFEPDLYKDDPQIVCGLVFGAAVHKNQIPGPGIYRRTTTAVRLYKEGVVDLLFFSGGRGDEDVPYSEATVMEDLALSDPAVSPKDVTTEGMATSTWENLLFSRPLIEEADCEVVVGISDRYHLMRINTLAALQGWKSLQTYPSDLTSTTWFEVRSVIREVAALLYGFGVYPFFLAFAG